MEKTKKISIVILDFLKSKRVVKNVDHIHKQETDFDVEIIIADNSCNKENREKLETLKKFDDITLIFNEKNLGYTKANNVAASKATGDYIFIVNPDILIKDPGSLQKIVDYMDKYNDIAILGPKQINDDTNDNAMTVRGFPTLTRQITRRTWFRKLPFLKKIVAYDEMQHLDYDKIQDVDWLQSSFVAVRSDFWKKVGGLEQDFFLFMSDPEICWKAWEMGKRVVYFPEVQVYADGIRCSSGGFKTFFKKWTMQQHLKDSLKYRWRHIFRSNPRKKFLKKII